MHVNELSPRSQDYLKAIWDHIERTGDPAPLGKVAERTGQKTSTASEAVKRLDADGLVLHEPYAGIRLTPLGRSLAATMVRRHRLMETFLVQALGYTWDEVHDDAEVLEHALSDRFVDRVDTFLGHPERDPHGDPIPREDGSVDKLSPRTLADVHDGQVTIEQVDDRDAGLLRHLAAAGIQPGVEVQVLSREAGIMTVEVAGNTVPLAESSLGMIRVNA